MNSGSDILALLPEIAVFLGAVVTLVAGSFLPRNRQVVARWIAIIALLTAAIAAAAGAAGPAMTVFNSTFAVDVGSNVARIIITLATAFVIVLGVEELSGSRRESETYSLLLLSALGTMVLAGTSDLLILVTGYLLASIPLYALIGMSRSARAAEAALKTYLLGALLGISMMVGVAVLYGIGGGTSYRQLGSALGDAPAAALAVGLAAVVGGLMFKAGGVPGHFWIPDATQAAGVSVAAYLTTVPKIGALVAAFRLLDIMPSTIEWPLVLAIVAAASMTLGNFAAFWQDDVRRLLGWSTVSQVGYLLLPVTVAGASSLALPSLLLYLVGYAATNLTAFAVVAAFPFRRTLADYRGVARSHPWLAGSLVVSLLGLIGTPPTVIFFGKLTTFTAAWDGGLVWLVVIAVINSVASVFYYLRWFAPMFFRPVERHSVAVTPTPTPAPSPTPIADVGTVRRRWAMHSAILGAASVVIIGVLGGVVLSLVGSPLAL
ncbi:MAG: NADH-quinone oxidoreductase subunit N [Cryobacterium sp.]|nr:NADH-quinone oxidoreductase subunit N [Micrococcales bacterium]MBX3308962.1 NADH-quinone oxidoreductase subunit N [Cryobacterium sp.]